LQAQSQSRAQQQEYSIIINRNNNRQHAYSKNKGNLDECKNICSKDKTCVAFHKFNKKDNAESSCFFYNQDNFKESNLVKDDKYSVYIKPKPSKK
jgi:hypothetical protein